MNEPKIANLARGFPVTVVLTLLKFGNAQQAMSDFVMLTVTR